ncbi:MAG: class I SAM-dependent methyltransferase [Candidatus Bathyarchaeota archaeon]|nr:class I SAM-dependent methyltransferase [Candidatus Bathyarchaeota archaeon]
MNLDVGSGYLHSHTARGDVNIDVKRPVTKPRIFVQADAHHLPFRSNLFEKTSFYEVIEHVENPTKALEEAFRGLRLNGTVEITIPNPWHWRKIFRVIRGKKLILSDTAHISTWTPGEMENLLINIGFKNISIKFITLPFLRIRGKHPILDGFAEILFPKPLGMRNIKVRARKCTKQ